LVTAYAREGPHGDITVSDQDARGVMGRLGLSDDKPLRKISDLSGGEKARVALSMFALKPANVILLDEPSNVSVVAVSLISISLFHCMILIFTMFPCSIWTLSGEVLKERLAFHRMPNSIFTFLTTCFL